ncbi:hypothetical protein RA2_02666 [Roseovarius sp. A-2]|nr:hypothetical protein RA2_02666 [Roseovarius sp. A-2]
MSNYPDMAERPDALHHALDKPEDCLFARRE